MMHSAYLILTIYHIPYPYLYTSSCGHILALFPLRILFVKGFQIASLFASPLLQME